MERAEVRVTRVELGALEPALRARLRAHLAPAERERYAALRDPAARERAELARGALRELLGRELGLDPAGLALTAGPHGKPALPARRDLAFNLSRTRGLALVALARGPGLALGVDVERADPALDPGELLPALAPAELAALAALPAAERARAALQRFVRKEAALKALGTGLGGPQDPARLALPAPGAGWVEHPGGMWLTDLALGPEHQGALALAGTGAGPRQVQLLAL